MRKSISYTKADENNNGNGNDNVPLKDLDSSGHVQNTDSQAYPLTSSLSSMTPLLRTGIYAYSNSLAWISFILKTNNNLPCKQN